MLRRDEAGLELRTDPTALAPERLLVFEVRGSISNFAKAIRQIPGLELIDEEELNGDEEDKEPVAYLLVPDIRALQNIESLWRRWGNHQPVPAAWRDVFSRLRDLRPWGAQDRVQPEDGNYLAEEIEGRTDDELVKIELELVFRADDRVAAAKENEVQAAVVEQGGRVVSRSRIKDIAYHALLADVPVRCVREILAASPEGIAGIESVMHIRPQSIATSLEIGDILQSRAAEGTRPTGEPILALLDGVPVAAHPLLARHLIVDDAFGLEPTAPVAERRHGTAMASLIVHGDRNAPEPALPRQIHVIPVMGAGDAFPNDRLIVDMVYTAIIGMRGENAPTAPGVLIVNLSLGNRRRPFHGQLSPWARLLDRLAYRLGILFLVSAGNVVDVFPLSDFANRLEFEDAPGDARQTGVLRGLNDRAGERRLFSPAETVNGITVGACNQDAVAPADRAAARVNIDPYPELLMSNPSSALGPGFAFAVKPDLLLPGAKEHLRVIRSVECVEVVPTSPSRSAGLKVAAPPSGGREDVDGFTNGTSAATALASRTCHRIHDALEATYGADFTNLTHQQRAVIVKALLIHPARWPQEAARLIRTTLGPAGGKNHVRQKDNIRRFLGYGVLDSSDAVACAADRATFWAIGTLAADKAATVAVPVPAVIGGRAQAHALAATLAWFTPVAPGRQKYRSVRLKLKDPEEMTSLRVAAHSDQPDANQSNRGTVFTRCWVGNKAPVVSPEMTVNLVVQREPDQGTPIDEPVPFGLAVTLTMPGVMEIYEQVRQRLGIGERALA